MSSTRFNVSWPARPRLVGGALALLTALYPFLVYFGLAHVAPRTIGLALIALLALRLALGWRATPPGGRAAALGVVGALALLMTIDGLAATMAYPVLVNAAFAALFAASLLKGPTAIERIARLVEPTLDRPGIAYTRRVTQVWLGFFVVNGAVSWATAVYGTLEQWTLYNGLIAYLLIGALFGGEYLVRRRVRHEAA